MEKILNDLDFGLLIWQLMMITVFVIVVFSLIKLYKKLINYLDRK